MNNIKMGQLESEQNSMFYNFCLEKHIPKNYPLRRINKLLNFKEIRKHLDSFYSHTGKPSFHPWFSNTCDFSLFLTD